MHSATISSGQSAATSEVGKRFWQLYTQNFIHHKVVAM